MDKNIFKKLEHNISLNNILIKDLNELYNDYQLLKHLIKEYKNLLKNYDNINFKDITNDNNFISNIKINLMNNINDINNYDKYYDIKNINKLLEEIIKYFNNLENYKLSFNIIKNLRDKIKYLIKEFKAIKKIIYNKMHSMKKQINKNIYSIFDNDDGEYIEYDILEKDDNLYEIFKYYLLNENFNNYINSIISIYNNLDDDFNYDSDNDYDYDSEDDSYNNSNNESDF